MNSTEQSVTGPLDVALLGAGIMSATLAVMLKELQADLEMAVFERLESAAQESSNAWNNAGTGHAALCELNYTPPRSDEEEFDRVVDPANMVKPHVAAAAGK